MDESTRGRLAEVLHLAHGDTVPDAIAVAVAVEHSFAVVLADDDIDPEHLCHPDTLTDTVIRYVDGR